MRKSRCCGKGREVAVTVALQTAPETPREEVEIRARSPFLGAKVANLSPALADELRLDAQAEGVVIVEHRRRLDRRNRSASSKGDIVAVGQQSEDRAISGPRSRHPRRRAAVAGHHQARRPADLGHVQWMSRDIVSCTSPQRGGRMRSNPGEGDRRLCLDSHPFSPTLSPGERERPSR